MRLLSMSWSMRSHLLHPISVTILLVSACRVCGFASINGPQQQTYGVAPLVPRPALSASLSSRPIGELKPGIIDSRTDDYYIELDDANPLIRLGFGEKEKVINAFGLWCAFVSALTCPFWMLAMALVGFLGDNIDEFDPNREIYDKTGKVWSKVWLSMTNSFPTISGDLQRLHEHTGPCLYVANHASWLDIPVLCTVLDPVFKFIAKGELTKVPCIGHQLVGGQHILIDREDRRSQLKTFRDGMGWLKRGVSIMAFPEGMRSPNGRLLPFKGGIFSMATKSKCPIIPITLTHTHAVMPSYSLLPIQRGGGKLHVHVHEPIDTTGKSDAELEQLVRQAFLSTLPECQHPVLDAAADAGSTSHAAAITTIPKPHHPHTHRSRRVPGHAHHQSLRIDISSRRRSTNSPTYIGQK